MPIDSTLGVNGYEVRPIKDKVFAAGSLGRMRCKAAFIGDSLLAGGELASLVSANCPAIVGVVREGVGGNTSSMVLARLTSDIPAYVDACFYLEEVNDVTTGVTYAQHMANVRSIVSNLLARKILPIVLLGGPLDGASLATLQKFRTGDILVASEYGVPCYDPFIASIDETDGGWIAADTTDGTHPTAAVYHTAGVALGTKVKDGEVASLRPTYNNVAHSLLPTNSLFLTDTNVDGVANNWGVLGGGAGVTASLTSGSSDGIRGNWQKLDCAAVTGDKQLFATNVTTGFSVGDRIAVTAAFKFTKTSGNPKGFFWVQFVGPSTREYLAYQVSATWDTTFLSAEVAVPAGTTGIQLYAQIGDTSSFTGSVQIGEVAFYNVTTLLA